MPTENLFAIGRRQSNLVNKTECSPQQIRFVALRFPRSRTRSSRTLLLELAIPHRLPDVGRVRRFIRSPSFHISGVIAMLPVPFIRPEYFHSMEQCELRNRWALASQLR